MVGTVKSSSQYNHLVLTYATLKPFPCSNPRIPASAQSPYIVEAPLGRMKKGF